MKELLTDAAGILPALVMLSCQLCCGQILNQRFADNKLGWFSTWVLGISVLALLNTIFLALGWGFLIHLNVLWLIFLPRLKLLKTISLKPWALPLTALSVFFLISNVLNPLIDWDVQCSYMQNARHWITNQSLSSEGLWHVYANRPQIVSVIWSWGLLWGNETTCQFLDLCLFLGVLVELIRRLKLKPFYILVLLSISAAPIVETFIDSAGDSQFTLKSSLLFRFIGSAGNEVLGMLIFLALLETLKHLPQHKGAWIILGIALINTRWNGITGYLILSTLALWFGTQRKQILSAILFTPVLGCGWYLWNWIVHKNPFYPHNPDIFTLQNSNAYLWEYFVRLTKDSVFGVKGVESFPELFSYLKNIGLSALLYPLCLLLRNKEQKYLMTAAWLIFISSVLTTAQIKFQFLSLLIVAGLVLSGNSNFKIVNAAKGFVLGILLATSFVSFKTQAYKAWYLLTDGRQGKEHLLKKRVRLYPACQWLNENADNNKIVLWPMNPYYYCQLPVIRADNAAYQIPNSIINDKEMVAEHFKELGVGWIVIAPPFYDIFHEPGPQAMSQYIQWMIDQDQNWELAATLEADGTSPETQIWKLKEDLKELELN